MKQNKIYEDKKINYFYYIMPAIGVILMIYFTALRLFKPENWAGSGYLVSMLFTIFWTFFIFLFTYSADIKPRIKLKKLRNKALKFGIKSYGKVINVDKEIAARTNGIPSKLRYYADVELENGRVITTQALLINPERCISNDVTVYEYENYYYVTDFKFPEGYDDNNIKENKKSIQYEIGYFEPTSIFQAIIKFIFGCIFTFFFTWGFINSSNNVTRIIFIPFTIISIGILLGGLLPLVFYNNQRLVRNIGRKVYLFGFLLYWFGFLIFFDYSAIKNGNVQLLIFSSIFWIIGIFALVKSIKK